jgi:hypothetical protein
MEQGRKKRRENTSERDIHSVKRKREKDRGEEKGRT